MTGVGRVGRAANALGRDGGAALDEGDGGAALDEGASLDGRDGGASLDG